MFNNRYVFGDEKFYPSQVQCSSAHLFSHLTNLFESIRIPTHFVSADSGLLICLHVVHQKHAIEPVAGFNL